MRSLSRKRPITAFLLLSVVVTIVAFGLPLLAENGIGLIAIDLPEVAPFVLVAALALAGLAFFVTSAAEGRSGVLELRRRVFHFRVNPLWYLLALSILPLAAVITATGVTGTNVVAEFLSRQDLMTAVAVEALIAFLLVNWWEEAAFTGFVLHRLQSRIGPVRASVVTTWMQASVHVPLVFVAGGVTDGRVGADQIPFYLAALFVLPIPVRMLITWLYNTAGRSIPLVGVFHAGLGVATGSLLLPEIAAGFDQTWVYAGFAVVAAIVLAFTSGRLGYEPGRTADSLVSSGGGVDHVGVTS